MAVAGAVTLALAAGCGSDSPQAGATSGESTETSSTRPEVDDPAVTAAALRTVDPCALLTVVPGLGQA